MAGYAIGYQKPPLETRFKKGLSGNPRGRPKQVRALNEKIACELDQVVGIDLSGTKQRISKRHVILLRLVMLALKGNAPALQLMLDLMQESEGKMPRPPTILEFEANDTSG